jgi:hypothetical protein
MLAYGYMYVTIKKGLILFYLLPPSLAYGTNFSKYSDLLIFLPFPPLFISQAKSTIVFNPSSVLYPLFFISSATLIVFSK